jgi:hypothetical protein
MCNPSAAQTFGAAQKNKTVATRDSGKKRKPAAAFAGRAGNCAALRGPEILLGSVAKCLLAGSQTSAGRAACGNQIAVFAACSPIIAPPKGFGYMTKVIVAAEERKDL